MSKQKKLLPETKNLLDGLKESFNWYIEHKDDVAKKDYIEFIDNNFVYFEMKKQKRKEKHKGR